MKDRRNGERSPVRVEMVVDDENRFRCAETVDLSAGGALLEAEEPVTLGERVTLIPLVATSAPVLELSARVVRVDPRRGTGRYRVAMKLELRPEEETAVEELRAGDWSFQAARSR
jgi:hypothetical protein